MNQADQYSKYNGLQRTDALHVLDNYFRLFRWNSNGNDVILDVGCGDGNVTMELLLPLLPKGFSKLVACDVSEAMIEYAKNKYKNKQVVFIKYDISTPEIPVDLEEGFDHIFSSYCFHWIQNQRQALKNLYNLLKPGGDVLLTFLANTAVFTVYENLAKNNKWAIYMQNVNKYVSPFQHSKNPEKEFEDLLCESGFMTHLCKIQQRTYTFPNFDLLKKSILAVNPFVSKVPENLKEDYLSDTFSELRKAKTIKIENNGNNNEEKVQGTYTLFIVYASKPL